MPFALGFSSMAALNACVEHKWLKAPLMALLEGMPDWDLQGDLLAGGYQLAAFRVEDDLYWEELCSLLDLDSDLPSIGLYDITVDEDGLPVLHSRSEEEE